MAITLSVLIASSHVMLIGDVLVVNGGCRLGFEYISMTEALII
jgi:hypothetical protein